MNIRLVEPSLEYKEDIWEFRDEVLKCDNGNEDQFAGCMGLRESNSASSRIQDAIIRKDINKCSLLGTTVPSNMYLAVSLSDNKIIGIIDLRHHINHPILDTWGGHIGYTVRPSERGHGYAIEMLRLDILEAKKMGIKRLLITCSTNNHPSEKTILANGGLLENVIDVDGIDIKRYWIETED